ncbi:complement C1q tumor necrosis factor-related protein 1 [Protopterus annectens]|uniref:complement C1q tumor necrosis factor-related protein 1 n=1 Tax=Protopterus annectens TaxID=7888 RepID=UPI001CFB87BC|nr:complement C1q tumor necrosis factor-related protein 1 [Protopterus annectens]
MLCLLFSSLVLLQHLGPLNGISQYAHQTSRSELDLDRPESELEENTAHSRLYLSKPASSHDPVRSGDDRVRNNQKLGKEPKEARCVRCCDNGPTGPAHPLPAYQLVPQINITILKGEKGDRGQRGLNGKTGREGNPGQRGQIGLKGSKGSTGPPGDSSKIYYAAFSVGRKKALHSIDYYQPLIFDTEFVNLYSHFNMFTGKFCCAVAGVYFFNLNVHTWNQKETYMHLMKNEQEMVILYAQPSDRSIMQSQSIMLELEEKDEVWVRMYKGVRDNAIFSDDYDTYITFNGYLIKAKSEP